MANNYLTVGLTPRAGKKKDKSVSDYMSDLVASRARVEQGTGDSGGFLGMGKRLLGTALTPLAPVLDLVSRPGEMVRAPIIEAIENVKERGVGALASGFGEELGAIGSAALGREKGATGDKLLDLLGVPEGKSSLLTKIARGTANLATEIGTDPLTYLLPGVGVVGKSAGEEIGVGLAKSGISKAVADDVAKYADDIAEITRGTTKVASKAQKQDVLNKLLTTESAVFENSAAAQALKAQAEIDFVSAATAAGKTIVANEVEAAGKKALKDAITTHLDDVGSKAKTVIEDSLKPRYAFKIRGKPVLTSELGPKAQKAYTAFQEAKPIKALRPSAMFPGISHTAMRRATNRGAKAQQAFDHYIFRDLLKGVSRSDQARITHAIESGIDLAEPELNAVKDQVKTHLDEMFNDEVAMGVRDAKEYGENYVPHVYQNKLRQDKARSFRESRKQAFQEGTPDAGKTFSVQAAHDAGLKTEDEIGKILSARFAKHTRDIARAEYERDMITNVAKRTTAPIENAAAYGLKELDPKNVGPQSIFSTKQLQKIKKDGEHWYMPQDYADAMYNTKRALSMDNPEEIKKIVGILDAINKKFKAAKTIYNPAYHVRNIIGDVWAASWDGVGARDYTSLFDRMAASKAGQPVKDYILSDGTHITFDDMIDMADEHASSTFIQSEVPSKGKFVSKVARRGSEIREDFPRRAHFIKAFQEEYDDVLARGFTGQEAVKKAADAAGNRVDKFLFDYSAVTPLEKQIKRVVPFYTYQRKMAPLLLETAFTNPGRLNRLNQYKRSIGGAFAPEADAAIPPDNWPDYLDPVQVGGGKEPWYVDLSGLATDPAKLLGIGGGTQETFAQQFAKLAPWLRIPMEQAAGHEFFGSQKPVSPLPQTLLEQFTPNWAQSGTGAGKALREKNLAELILPAHRLSEENQKAALSAKTKALRGEISAQNEALLEKGLDIRTSNRKSGKVYRLVDVTKDPPRTIKVFKTAAEAQRAGNELAR